MTNQEKQRANIMLRYNLKSIFAVFSIAIIILQPLYLKAESKKVIQSGFELSFEMETLKMISSQSARVKINIDRNGFEEPITLKAEYLPDGFEVEFEENPVEGDEAYAWIYSPVNVLQCENTILVDSYENPEVDAKLRIMVNCGIEWVEQFGSTSGDALHNDKDIGNAVTTDSSGNIYVVGNTFGTVDSQNPNMNTNSDAWVAKYANDGTQEWIRQTGGESTDRVVEVAVDNAGNVFIGGTTEGAMPDNFHRGNVDYWIAKYNNSGEIEWLKQNGDVGQDGKFGMAIIPDNQGGATLATIINERTGAAAYDYDNDGNSSFVGGGNIDLKYRSSPYDLALSIDGGLYVVGSRSQGNSKRGYILKFDINDMSNNVAWEIDDLAITGDREATRVIADSNSDIYVAGTDVIFGTDTNGWFGKFSGSNGNALWSGPSINRVFSQRNREDRINTLGLNPDGDLVIAGNTKGVIGERNAGSGTEDAWYERYDSSTGQLKYVNQFAVRNNDSIEAVAFDNNDGVIFAGRTIEWKSNIGSTDALLMKFKESPRTLTTPAIYSISVETTSNGGQFLKINGVSLYAVTSVRINGIPQGIVIKKADEVQTDFISGIPPGTANVTVSANCITLRETVTIN